MLTDQQLDRQDDYMDNVYYLCTKLNGMDKETTMGVLDMHKYYFYYGGNTKQQAIDLTIETLGYMKELTEQQLQQILDTWADEGIGAAIKLKDEMMNDEPLEGDYPPEEPYE